MNKDKVKNLTLTALFMALVVIGSRIYVGTHDTFRFHLGNSMCLLSALFLSPIYAGIASGVGSMIFDIIFYPSGLGCLVTLITKFIMGYVASSMFNVVLKNIKINLRIIFSGTIAEIAYIFLYGIKTYIERRFILSMDIRAVIPILIAKLFTSAINAVIAVFISLILYKLISKVKKPQNKP